MTYREVEWPCPECGTALTQYPQRDKWRCSGCGGALVGSAELTLEIPTDASSTARPRPCAGCSSEMYAFELAGLTLDHCAPCHLLWFDRGELGRLRSALADPTEGWAQQWATFVRFAL